MPEAKQKIIKMSLNKLIVWLSTDWQMNKSSLN